MTRTLLIATFPFMLAACGGGDVEENDGVVLLDAGPDAGVTRAGTFEVLQDGEVVGTTRIEADGRYTETYPDGAQITGRTRRETPTRICFEPDDESTALCFSEGDPRPDGSYEVVGDDGSTAIVRPVG